MNNLPDEILVEILLFCEVEDYNNIQNVSKRFYNLLDNEYLMGVLFKRLLQNAILRDISSLKSIIQIRKIIITKSDSFKFIKKLQLALLDCWIKIIVVLKLDIITLVLVGIILILSLFYLIFCLILFIGNMSLRLWEFYVHPYVLIFSNSWVRFEFIRDYMK